MGGLSLISEEGELELMESTVSTEFMPEPRRSFHRNPPITSRFKNSRLNYSYEDDSLPEPRPCFHQNQPMTSSFGNSRKSLSIERIDPVAEPCRSDRLSISTGLSYDNLGLVTLDDGEMEGMCDSRGSIERSHNRWSFHRLSLSSALSCGSSRSSFHYDKLAQLPISLTIVKLDGSSFDIDVSENATVADLKEEIEDIFSRLPIEEASKISWEHVWGSFCLSYSGFELLDDGEILREYGLNDGDKLHFIRHTSTEEPTKKQARKRIDTSKPHTLTEEEGKEVEYNVESEDMPLKHDSRDNASQRQSIIHRLFRGWFAYSQVSSGKRVAYEGTVTPRRRAFVEVFKNAKD